MTKVVVEDRSFLQTRFRCSLVMLERCLLFRGRFITKTGRWDLEWLLLTGGHCPEMVVTMVVTTSLTVFRKLDKQISGQLRSGNHGLVYSNIFSIFLFSVNLELR